MTNTKLVEIKGPSCTTPKDSAVGADTYGWGLLSRVEKGRRWVSSSSLGDMGRPGVNGLLAGQGKDVIAVHARGVHEAIDEPVFGT